MTPQETARCLAYRTRHPARVAAANARWKRDNPAKVSASRQKWQRDNIERSMLIAARKRAKWKGLEFTIVATDIVVPTHCPVLGIPLISGRTGAGKRTANSPSLDRIDSTRGYTPNNIWVISWRANDIKSNATLEELERLVAAIRSRTCL